MVGSRYEKIKKQCLVKSVLNVREAEPTPLTVMVGQHNWGIEEGWQDRLNLFKVKRGNEEEDKVLGLYGRM